jgi:hypothetical protein
MNTVYFTINKHQTNEIKNREQNTSIIQNPNKK